MNRHWLVACLTLTSCAAVGVLALYAAEPRAAWDSPAYGANSRNFVRIELPPVQVGERDQGPHGDTAVMPAVERAAAVVPGSQLAVAAGLPGQTQALERSGRATDREASGPGGMIELSFNLAESGHLDRTSLDVRKGVRFNGAIAGQATIRVGAGSALFIASEDLRTLLSSARRADLAERLDVEADAQFLGFDEIRQKGLSLRYDAASDQILISG